MAYADKTFYRTTYYGRECSVDATLEKWLTRASDDIDTFCGYSFTFDDLETIQQTIIKRAVCAQAENYIVNGDGADDFDSVSLGSFSISGGAKQNTASICDKAKNFVFCAGVFTAAIPCGTYRG